MPAAVTGVRAQRGCRSLPSFALALALAACESESPRSEAAANTTESHGAGIDAREGEDIPAPAQTTQRVLSIGAFSSAREAFGAKILPQFARHWLRGSGEEVRFRERYEGSLALAEAIENGWPADVAVFASTEHLGRLAVAGFVDPAWRAAPFGGIVSHSLVVLGVRQGNPKQIREWADLAKPGLGIVIADPEHSGGGAWSVCALYGAALRGHAGVPPDDRDEALAFVRRVLANVVVKKPSACDAWRTFQDGEGDVAITYESEVSLGWTFGHSEERVIPASTMLVEHAAVVILPNAERSGGLAAARALVRHLWSEEAQRCLAAAGIRPVDPAVAARYEARFPRPRDLWTIADLGGWDRAVREVLVPVGFAAPAPGK